MNPILAPRDDATKTTLFLAYRHILPLPPKKISQPSTPGAYHTSAFIAPYLYQNTHFTILVTDNPPAPYDRHGLETSWARTTDDVCFHNRTAHNPTERHRAFLKEVSEKIKHVAAPTIVKMAGGKVPGLREPLPKWEEFPVNVEEYLFRETVKLQIVTKSGVMMVVEGHGSGGPVAPRGIPFGRAEELGVGDVERVEMKDVKLLGRVEEGIWMYKAAMEGLDAKTYWCVLIEDWNQGKVMQRLEELAKTRQEDNGKLRALVTCDSEGGQGVIGILVRRDAAQS